MRRGIVDVGSRTLVAKVFLCLFLSCLVVIVSSFLEDSSDTNKGASGWSVDDPFLGFSVSMVFCLAVLLLLSPRTLALFKFTLTSRGYKNFSAVVLWLSIVMVKLLLCIRALSSSIKYMKQEHTTKNKKDVIGSVPWFLDVSESIRVHKDLFLQLVKP